MKTLTITILSLICLTLHAQNLEKAILKGKDLMTEDLEKATPLFERIAQAEPDEWLPAYYAALSHYNLSWLEDQQEKSFSHLREAQKYYEAAISLAPENPEIQLLQALIYTAYVAQKPSVYGMKYSAKVSAIYKTLSENAPNNPRVVFNHTEWKMGAARYYGKNTTVYCDEVDRAVELFRAEENQGVDPSWGLQRALMIQEDCRE